jgi:hypothetical protein
VHAHAGEIHARIGLTEASCLDCDSVMNYSWHTRDRVFVTQTDIEAVGEIF